MTRRLLLFSFVCLALAPAAAARAATPGALAQLPGLNACITENGADFARANGQECITGSGLTGVDVATISPDGKNVYATGFTGDISIMSRDPATGALSPVGCISPDGTDGGSGSCVMGPALDEPNDVRVSPDGKNVYIASFSGVAIFDRDPATGLLTVPNGTSCVSEDGSGGKCVHGKDVAQLVSLAISPNGKNLYAADRGGGVAVLQRSADGSLAQSTTPGMGCISEDGKDPDNLPAGTPCATGKALGNAGSLTISPDGKQVYVIDLDQTSAIAVLNRNTSTGELTQAADATACVSLDGTDRGVKGACSIGRGILEGDAIRVSPDGRNVYVTGFESSAIAIFNRDPSTGELSQDPGLGGCVSEDTSDSPEGPQGSCSKGRGLEIAAGVSLSPDGKFVYATSAIFGSIAASPVKHRGIVLTPPTHASGGLAVFSRDPASGALQQLPGAQGCINEVGGVFSPAIADGCAPGITLQGAIGTVPSPDGSNVYVVSEDGGGLAEFGPAPSVPAPVPGGATGDITAPKVDGFKLTHRVFAVAATATPVSAVAHGTAFRFRLSEPAAVKISMARLLPGRRAGKSCRKPAARLRHHRACTRSVSVGTLRRAEAAGPGSAKFSGRIGRRALKPGRYRATITATDAAGNTSARQTTRFRVVGRRH